jgi:hypothetical protein
VRAGYVVTDGSVTPDGDVLALDGLGTTVWRLGGPLVSTTTVRGLYPNDTWSRGTVTWSRRRCRGGSVAVGLSSDPSLFADPQTVTAYVDGREVARTRLRPNRTATLQVPLPEGRRTCVVRFRVSPTAVPAEVLEGSSDRRVLGAHFNAFAYTPAQ